MCNNINSFYSNKWLDKPIKGILLNITGLSSISNSDASASLMGFVMMRHSGIPYRLLINESNEIKGYSTTKFVKGNICEVVEENNTVPTPIIKPVRRRHHENPILDVYDEDLDFANCTFENDETKSYSTTKYVKGIDFEDAEENNTLPFPIINSMRRRRHMNPFLDVFDEDLDLVPRCALENFETKLYNTTKYVNGNVCEVAEENNTVPIPIINNVPRRRHKSPFSDVHDEDLDLVPRCALENVEAKLCNTTKYVNGIDFEDAEENNTVPTPIINTVRRRRHKHPILDVHDEVLNEILTFDDYNTANGMVLGDGGPTHNYYNINRAYKFLVDRPGHLFGLGKGQYFKSREDHGLNIHNLTNALQISTATKAMIIRNPPYRYYLNACKEMGLKPKEVVMFGVTLRSIRGAQQCGIRCVMIKTNKYGKLDRKALKAGGVVLDLHEAMMLIVNYSPKEQQFVKQES